MLIERPPLLYRRLIPEALWRVNGDCRPTVYLTFDDGPIPEVTPWVLDLLDEYHVKATFFMVGDNVRRHPELLSDVLNRGHSVGNHTMHHMQGIKVDTWRYLRDVAEASVLIDSRLFRPPHGLMRRSQAKAVSRQFKIVMHDVVSRDYSSHLTPQQVLDNVQRYTRPGSIIVFHDSLKAERNLRTILPQAIVRLLAEGYSIRPLPMK